MASSKAGRLADRYRVRNAGSFRLRDVDPDDTGGLSAGPETKSMLAAGVGRLSKLQELLYAQDRWSLLLVFQAMDAAGKDSTIEHVMSGVNPQGCQVFSFKAPSAEELDHDFLWRTTRCLPERGRIGIFNRSYYEEVLVVRVHPEILDKQHLPAELVTRRVWQERFESINDFERHLARNGTVVRKFFLHVSKEEQLRRFVARMDDPAKQWKFSAADAGERARWDDYMTAYEKMIRHTSTRHAPWYVVPADHKWFTRLVVAGVVVDALDELDMRFPTLDPAQRSELAAMRAAFAKELAG